MHCSWNGSRRISRAFVFFSTRKDRRPILGISSPSRPRGSRRNRFENSGGRKPKRNSGFRSRSNAKRRTTSSSVAAAEADNVLTRSRNSLESAVVITTSARGRPTRLSTTRVNSGSRPSRSRSQTECLRSSRLCSPQRPGRPSARRSSRALCPYTRSPFASSAPIVK